MSSYPYHPPHKTLGKYLKTMRQRLQESLGETSGAVEIEVEMLDRIERGELLPSEDILLLLISHFSLKEDEAVELWKLAGYDQNDDLETSGRPNNKGGYMVMLAFDTRVLYTNHSAVETDESGVTVSFMQPTGADQSVPVSRIGMSYDQAERLAARLQSAVLKQRFMHGPKRLQSSTNNPSFDPNDPLHGPQPPQTPPNPSIAPKPPKPWTPPRPDEPDKV